MKVQRALVYSVASFVLAPSADASVIWVYKEVETVSASVSITGYAGETYLDSQEVNGAILLDPLVSQISAGADPTGFPNYQDYLDPALALGSGAAITQLMDGTIEFSASTGYGDCGLLGCGAGTARASMDLTFRPDANAALQVNYYPSGGTVDALLADLTTGTIIYQDHVTRYWPWNVPPPTFEFTDNHLYRWVATGLGMSPPAGDPYGDFSIRFYDRVTDQGAAFAPVPEPISMLLVGTGVGGLILRRRAKLLRCH